MIKVSQSKVRLFRSCKQAYHFKYIENLKKRRIRRPFQFGKLIHSMIEADANGDNPFKLLEQVSFDNRQMFAAEKEMYGEIIQDAKDIMKGYFDYWPEDSLFYKSRKGKFAEHEFEIEIAKGIVAKGIIDAVVKTPNKLVWLCEHKTFSRLPSEDHRWRSLQSAVYLRVIEKLGWWSNVAGVCWNYISSKPLSEPLMKKDGELSTKNCNTMPHILDRVFKRHGLDKGPYKNLIEAARQNQKSYYRRIFSPIKPPVVEKLYQGFVDTAQKIAQYHETQIIEKNMGLHCDFCDYEPLCRAELLDSDVDFIKEKDYYVEEQKSEEPSSE